MTSLWYNCKCINCSKENWINNGDLEDLTVSDVEAFVCWNCGEVQCVDDEVVPNYQGQGILVNLHTVDGKMSPLQ